jgi:hypothetical protein
MSTLYSQQSLGFFRPRICSVHVQLDPFQHLAFRAPVEQKLAFRKSDLEGSLLQKVLDLGDMVALDHNVPSRPVDHDLLLGKTQKLPQLIPQNLRLSVNLLHPSHGLVSSGLFQGVDGQVAAWGPGDKVWQIGRAKVRL